MNFDTIDPHLSKLRISEGGKHISRNAASSRPTRNEEDLIARSTRRREFIKENCEELRRYHHTDAREPVAEIGGGEVVRTGTCRMRKLWDFDSTDADMNNNISKNNSELMPRLSMEDNKSTWTAKDIRREHRQTVTRQVRQDILEMEQGMRRWMHLYNPREDGTSVVLSERDDGGHREDGVELRLTISNEENETSNYVKSAEDGYGKLPSPSKAGRKPYIGMNEEYQSLSLTQTNSHECASTSTAKIGNVTNERAARLQRIRELNKQNYKEREANESESVTRRVDTVDEIMPPVPRYYSIIRERNERIAATREANESS